MKPLPCGSSVCAIPLDAGRWLVAASCKDAGTAPLLIADGCPMTLRMRCAYGDGSQHPLRFRRAMSLRDVAVRVAATPAFRRPRWGVLHPPLAKVPLEWARAASVPVEIASGGDAIIWLSAEGTPNLVNEIHERAATGCRRATATLDDLCASALRALSLDPRR